MKKYSDFLKQLHENKVEEASGKNFIDVFDEDKPFGEPIYRVHRDDLIDELEGFLMRVQNGTLERVSVFAELPTHGKNKPSYLADTLPTIKRKPEIDDEENPWAEPKSDWDDSGSDDAEEPMDDVEKEDPWIDVEFEVVGVDVEQNLVVGMPYSMRRKKITTPIHPKYVQEIYYKKAKRNVS